MAHAHIRRDARKHECTRKKRERERGEEGETGVRRMRCVPMLPGSGNSAHLVSYWMGRAFALTVIREQKASIPGCKSLALLYFYAHTHSHIAHETRNPSVSTCVGGWVCMCVYVCVCVCIQVSVGMMRDIGTCFAWMIDESQWGTNATYTEVRGLACLYTHTHTLTLHMDMNGSTQRRGHSGYVACVWLCTECVCARVCVCVCVHGNPNRCGEGLSVSSCKARGLSGQDKPGWE